MLVFSRKKNEVFYVGNDVTITVVEIRGDKIKLGIDAPANVVVDRYEVRQAKQREKESFNG